MHTTKKDHSNVIGKINLIELLKTFSKDEMKELLKFAKSSLFNNRSEVTKYASIMMKYHPSFDQKNFNKKEVHSQVFHGKKFEDINLRRLNSHLLKIAEDFLYFNHGKNCTYEKDRYVIMEYIKRDSIHLAESKIDHSMKDLKLDSLPVTVYFDRRSELYNLKSRLEEYRKKGSLYGIYLLKACSDKITSSFSELANSYTELYMTKELVKIDFFGSALNSCFENIDSEKMLQQLKTSGDENYPYLRMHILMTKCIKNTLNDGTYEEFSDLLRKYENRLSHDTLVEFGIFRYNYIFQKLKDITPRVAYLGMYELIKELCQKNLLKYSFEPYIVKGLGGLLGAGDLAGSKGDLEFLIFLREHMVKQLHPDFRFLTDQFLKLHECYILKKYDECVKILNSTNVDHYFYYSRFKILEVQVFFDMSEYERVLNLVDAFKHFYKKRPKSAKFFGVVMKFLNVVARLSKLSISFSKEEAQMIEKAINEIEASLLRNWLVPRLQLISDRINRVS